MVIIITVLMSNGIAIAVTIHLIASYIVVCGAKSKVCITARYKSFQVTIFFKAIYIGSYVALIIVKM